MDDALMKSAHAYRELLPYCYHYTLGHKNKLSYLSVSFPSYAYYHLAGFHKVGIEALANKNHAVENILNGCATEEQFTRAGVHLNDRWEGICNLKGILEDAHTVFRYRGHEPRNSRIQADYLMINDAFAFFIKDRTPESIFARKNNDYERNCPRLTVLEIVKENLNVLGKECIYRSSSYIYAP